MDQRARVLRTERRPASRLTVRPFSARHVPGFTARRALHAAGGLKMLMLGGVVAMAAYGAGALVAALVDDSIL